MTQTPPESSNSSSLAMWGGIAFSLVFTGVIAFLGPRLLQVPHAPDQGASWYYWKLIQPTFATRASVWGLYIAHQLISWGLIFAAQRASLKYTSGLHRYNVYALAANAVFVVLHLVQTHVWYDGLAQDVSIWSSLGSVAVLLIWVLLLEAPRRGLFWGYSPNFSPDVMGFARKYHGYYFSWAILYTFWYHPMEGTSGHLVGFFYIFLLMVQSSLFFTRAHLHRWWTLALEVIVLIHGTMVAIMQGQKLAPMFAFGFGGIFVLTQMHGLSLRLWQRLGILGLYLGGIFWVYSQRGWKHVNEVLRIPIIDYVSVFLLVGLIWLGLKLFRREQATSP